MRAARGGRRRIGYAMLDLIETLAIDARELPAMINIDIGTWPKDGIGH